MDQVGELEFETAHTEAPRKKCNRNCRPPELGCGVLFNHIHCTKTIRGVSSNSELEKIKQIHKESAFQNGNI